LLVAAFNRSKPPPPTSTTTTGRHALGDAQQVRREPVDQSRPAILRFFAPAQGLACDSPAMPFDTFWANWPMKQLVAFARDVRSEVVRDRRRCFSDRPQLSGTAPWSRGERDGAALSSLENGLEWMPGSSCVRRRIARHIRDVASPRVGQFGRGGITRLGASAFLVKARASALTACVRLGSADAIRQAAFSCARPALTTRNGTWSVTVSRGSATPRVCGRGP